jgi:diguanylate cyclase (GGDEF)-like protein
METVELFGHDGMELVHPDDRNLALSQIGVAARFPGRAAPSNFRLRTSDGSWLPFEMNLVPLDGAGLEGHLGVIGRLTSPRVAMSTALTALARSAPIGETMRLLCDAVSEAGLPKPSAIVYDDDQGNRQVTQTSLPLALTGFLDAEADGSDPWSLALARSPEPVTVERLDLLPPGIADTARSLGLQACAVLAVSDPAGRSSAMITCWVAGNPGRAQPLAHYLAGEPREVLALALERRDAERRLRQAALHDPLTGLPNRGHFFQLLEAALLDTPPTELVAVLVVDLAGFKELNDAWGHVAGDRTLIEVARRLRAAAQDADVVARLSGDEFAVVLTGLYDAEEVQDLADPLLDHLDEPIDLGPVTIRPKARLGSATCEANAATPEMLVRAADAALRDARRVDTRWHVRRLQEG